MWVRKGDRQIETNRKLRESVCVYVREREREKDRDRDK